MYRCLLLSTLLMTLSGFAEAGESEAAEKADAGAARPRTSVALLANSTPARQNDTLFLAPSDSKTIGVLVDYRPFDSSGFNLSAGSITNSQTTAYQTTPSVQRAYLGVGWRRLLDDAQNLRVRVDVGAIYDDHQDLEAAYSGQGSADTAQQLAPSDWIPVVSFGVSYRF